ncbi:DUF2252 domain-containing protein [uncultured Sphaerotilus sp.]|uniref:DUF2252 domain-containing protein n=1 Tax=uncultured Sphaerotilus sp. TaxID=474984 RepID=UPI0030CA47C1
MNTVKKILRFNEGRDPVRLAMKYQAMRTNPFVFLRGSCHLFHARLPVTTELRKAPAVWTCGDLHLENFGSYKGDSRQVQFDINDFDESLLAPATWDLVRLLTSVVVGRQSGSLGRRVGASSRQLCEVLLQAYVQALVDGKARWVDRDTAPPPVSDLLQAVRGRSRPEFLDSRTELKGRQRRIRVDGQKALMASEDEQAKVRAFMAGFASEQAKPRFFDVLDVAQRIAGTGSLGVERYIVLVRGKGSPDGNYLLDLKKATPSSLQGHVPTVQPAWPDEAHRIVAIQQRMQAAGMAFLHAVRLEDTPFVLRALLPSEDRVTLAQVGRPVARLQQLLVVMGQCLAWAQLRSSGRGGAATADELIAFGQQLKWRVRLIDLAHACAEDVQADWASFAAACEDGTVPLSGGGPGA